MPVSSTVRPPLSKEPRPVVTTPLVRARSDSRLLGRLKLLRLRIGHLLLQGRRFLLLALALGLEVFHVPVAVPRRLGVEVADLE